MMLRRMKSSTAASRRPWPCPTCGAEAGWPCRANTTGRVTDTHAARLIAPAHLTTADQADGEVSGE